MNNPLLYKPKVYTASRLNKSRLWLIMRDDPDWNFVEWTATWPMKVEEEGEADITDTEFGYHWTQDIKEIRDSDFVLLYGRDPGLRGALVECGAALAFGIGVVAVGLDPDHTWSYHPHVKRVENLIEARNHLFRYTVMVPPKEKAK